MIRLVFRPYTQVWRSICTSEPLRASIRVSSDFTLLKYSSSSFGSQQTGSYSDPLVNLKIRPMLRPPYDRGSGTWEITFISPKGLTPKDSPVCWTPWSVFQDGSLRTVLRRSYAHKVVHNLSHPRQKTRNQLGCFPAAQERRKFPQGGSKSPRSTPGHQPAAITLSKQLPSTGFLPQN